MSALLTTSPAPVLAKENVIQKAAKGELRPVKIRTSQGVKTLPFISASHINAAATALRTQAASARDQAQEYDRSGRGNDVGVSRSSLGCGNRNSDGNVRVNQDCGFRLQGEESIKWNPANPNNLVAGLNDERQGYNYGAFAYSFDGGKTWGDDIPPFYHKLNNPPAENPTPDDPNRHTITGAPGNFFTYDGGSDPTNAVDLEGRAYYSLIIFDRLADFGAAVVVTQSPAGAGGSFYNDIRPFGRRFVVTEDNDPVAQHDKQFITTDVGPNSPNRDNVYVTWTVFKFDPKCGPQPNPSGDFRQCQSPIFGSMSTDHALTWSTPEMISGSSDLYCFGGNVIDPSAAPNACNQDQGSDPITLPNGDLEVIFNNGNTRSPSPNAQQLGVHCRPIGKSTDGTAHLRCGAPSKVGNDITVGEPQCDFGRGPEECIPGAYVRTDDYPRIAENRGNGHLYATWQDYRNGEYDIQLSESSDGGLTWTESKNPVNPDRGKDHYEAAVDVVCSGPLAANNPNCVGGGNDDGSRGGASDQNSNLCTDNNGGGQASRAQDAGGDDAQRQDHVAVSYYRTCRVPGENAPGHTFSPRFVQKGTDPGKPDPGTAGAPAVAAGGSDPGVQQERSDYVLAGGRGVNGTPYDFKRLSPTFLPPDGEQSGFMGDYSSITVVGQTAHPIWSDQRNQVPAEINNQPGTYDPPMSQGNTRDEDVFTTASSIPDGRGREDDAR